MEMRKIGKTDIQAAGLGLGCWAIGGGLWWGDNDDRMSIETICRALDLGINWVDTARVYGFGHSEEVVGKALKELPRHKVVLSTKCGIQWYDKGGELHFTREGHEVRRDLSPKAIRRDLELSLKALGTDYIDVYYTHWQCMTYGLVPVAETMGELMRMKEEGKIRAIGASNVNLQILRDYEAAGQLDVIQEKLSILDRKPEAELLPSKGNVREGKTWWKPENIAAVNRMLAGWRDLTEKYHCSLANLCIKWNSMLSPDINVLCGARKVSQVEDSARSLDIPMSQEDFHRMKKDADKVISMAGKK